MRLPADLAALAAGGKAALARCLSALESAPDDPALVALLEAAWAAPRGIALGLTGPPGVGKSTLTGALVAGERARGHTVGVVAVDPSSRRTGGALLGDRTRIATDPGDAGAFVRSMAAGDHLGGLSAIAFPAVVLMRAVFDRVIVETVGVGQSEAEIADCADLVAFCVQPGSGDALQFMKAGVMELPDIFFVTKADLGAPARRALREVRGALSLGSREVAPAQLVSAESGDGVAEALDAIEGLIADRVETGTLLESRKRQGAVWIESRLRDSYGREGAAALVPRLPVEASPFGAHARLVERVKAALHQAFKTI